MGLPEGVIHADLFPDNVFFLSDRLSGFIDFYFACTDILAYDVAVCLNAWCFEKDFSFNLTKGAAFLRGYNSVRPLSVAEINALPVLARGAAVRFMLTRLYDWLTVPDGSFVMKKIRWNMCVVCASIVRLRPRPNTGLNWRELPREAD